MRDVSHKVNTYRTARARATVRTTQEAVQAVKGGVLPKGDPIPVARVAAIQAAKATATLIPFCHPVPIDFVSVDFEFSENEIVVTASVKAVYKTGVEMEALTAASVAALNLYDMIKPIETDIEIVNVVLLEKTGGKSDRSTHGSYPVGVVTVSDRASRGEYEDRTGPAVVRLLMESNQNVIASLVVPDEIEAVRDSIDQCLANGARIVLTLGGTGVSARDVTPEAVAPLLEKEIKGVAETVYAYGRDRTPFAALSRVLCGTYRQAVVLTLPGSPSGAVDGATAALPALLHAIEVMDGVDHSRVDQS